MEHIVGLQRDTPEYATLPFASIHSSFGSSIFGRSKLSVGRTPIIYSDFIEYCCLRNSIKAFFAMYFSFPSTLDTTSFQNSIASTVCFIPGKFSISHSVILFFGCNN